MALAPWNELVAKQNRLLSENRNARPASVSTPTHIVIHVTGTNSLEDVKRHFLAANSVSAHYLIAKDGTLFQFVPDAYRAWHAGIDSNSRTLYRKGGAAWKRHLKYFSWYKGYPAGSIFVDGDLDPVWDPTAAAFVKRGNGQPWSEYQYFDTRWMGADMPINFQSNPDPNSYSIGIETLGFGSRNPDPKVYTPQMYSTLETLLVDLSRKYGIPLSKGRVVGHEDIHPVGRFGWDPSIGFDWARVHTDADDA